MADQKPRPFKALKKELAAVKTRWSDVKLFWKKPNPPWPVRIQRVLSQPPPYAFDVDDFKVVLFVDGPNMDTLPVHVEVTQKELPGVLTKRIAQEIETKWKAVLSSQLENMTTRSWLVKRLLVWIESQFSDFLRLMPELLESYMGVDTNGASLRRYTIVEVADEEEAASAVVERVYTEEELERKAMVVERRKKKRAAAMHKAACEADAARSRAMRNKEMGIDQGGASGPQEKKLTRKEKQGVRQRKTGARATKFAGEGSALEKGLSKKEKKKRADADKK